MAIIYENLTRDHLIKAALLKGEGELASNGALNVQTGTRTGRSPKDRFIVKDALTENTVDWGAINQPYSPLDFDKLWDDACRSLNQYPIYEADCWAGSKDANGIRIKVRCNLAWHTLFCKILFLPPQPEKAKDEWLLVNASQFMVEGSKYNLQGTAAIVLDFTNKRILVCGTLYAGEMKKAIFSVLNFLYPAENILPMHCAANRSASGNVALFFGLSGTGKTTLSADPSRYLIGDDEHGWAAKGIFNFEGGCYAKCIHLSYETEPFIWSALRPGALLENVVLDPLTKTPIFADDSLTENTRAAYPLDYIERHSSQIFHEHPENVIFLTCDLYGVLPPVSKLTDQQIAYYFLSGYTALVGSTENGHLSKVTPTFSQCFGAPFFSRPPEIYATLLKEKLEKQQTKVYLVNTGWYGGSYGEGGQRYPLSFTRHLITSIIDNKLNDAPFKKVEPFDLLVPHYLPGIETSFLESANLWDYKDHYQEKAHALLNQFKENYHRKGFHKISSP